VIGSNFHFCVARFKFSQSAFLRVVSVSVVRKCYYLMRNDELFGVAQFMRDNYYSAILLTKTLALIQYYR